MSHPFNKSHFDGFGSPQSRTNRKFLREISGDAGGSGSSNTEQGDTSKLEIKRTAQEPLTLGRLLTLLKAGHPVKITIPTYQEIYVPQIQRKSRLLPKAGSKGTLGGVRQARARNLSGTGGENSKNPSSLETRSQDYQGSGDSGRETSGRESGGFKRPDWIDPKHWDEWVEGSAVEPEIAALNLKSLEDSLPYDYLCYSDKIQRLNTGRLPGGILNKYRFVEKGGWWASGIDILTAEDSLWGCFKPDQPRHDGEGKLVKYEHPVKAETEIFALRCPYKLWELIERRYNVSLPSGYKQAPASAFWQWVKDHPQIPVILTEGVKKAGAILSCGYVVIALPGVWNGIRTPKDEFGEKDGDSYLIPQLKAFAQKGRRIYICFDQDKKRKTVRAVNRAIKKYSWLFKQHECEAKIISWHPTFGKGIDDAIVGHGRDFFDDVYRNAKSFSDWETGQLRQPTYTPDLVLNQQFLGEFLPPHDAQLICLKAPKKTGKTEWMSWYSNAAVTSGERRVLLITHLIQLGLQTAKRLKIPYISDLKNLAEGDYYGFGLCIDSLHPKSQARFNPDDEKWHGAWIVIDEVNQVIWHLLNSTTCEKERVSIIKTLKQLLKTIRETGGKVIIADADLNDISIDFIKGLMGDVTPWIMVNEYTFKEDAWEVYHYNDKDPSGVLREAEAKLDKGQKIMFCVSGQKAKSKWGSKVLEQYFQRKFPDLKILRIDSETVADPNHPAFGCTENLNEIISQYDLVIASPTIETGVSITKKHFDCVFGIFQGVQTTDSVRQHLSRYRLPVERHIWISKVGINRVGNGDCSVNGLLAGVHQLSAINIKRLVAVDPKISIDGNFESICLNTWAKFGAIINLGMRDYANQILKDLAAEGHTIIDVDAEEKEAANDAVKNAVTAVKNEVYQEECEEISAAESPSDDQYKILDKQRTKTKKERLEYRKGFLERRYLVDVTPDLIKKDDEGWHSKIRLHYYLSQGIKFLEERDLKIASNALIAGDGDVFLPDINSKLLGTKIAGLERMGISSLILGMGDYQEFHAEHPLVVDIFNKCKDNAWWIKLALGLGVSSIKKPVEMCQYLLKNLLGLKLPRLRREKLKDGSRRWVYGCAAANFEKDPQNPKKLVFNSLGQAIPAFDGREDIFRAWLERDIKAKEAAEAQAIAATQQQILPEQHADPMQQEIAECIGWMREAIAQNDPEFAQDINSTLSEVSKKHLDPDALRKGIWEQLSIEERSQWKILTKRLAATAQPDALVVESQPIRRGSLCKLREDLSHLPAWIREIASLIPTGQTLSVDSAPRPISRGDFGTRWELWVNTPTGCKAVDLDALEFVGG